jgi:hypothetical protein
MRGLVLTAAWHVSFSVAVLVGGVARGGNPQADGAATANEAGLQAPPDASVRTQQSIERWYDLEEAASAALKAGRTDEALRDARELLAGATGRERNWNYGNAIHNGNVILGRIALEAGDVAKAKECRAAATPASFRP